MSPTLPGYPRWVSKFQVKPGSWVFIPSETSIQFGMELKFLIREWWTPPDYFYHLRNGGHVAALRAHLANTYFLHIDIKDFFGCINRSRLTRHLKAFVPYNEARDWAIASTVKQISAGRRVSILPFGFVQSPILSSLVLDRSKLGRLIGELNGNRSVSVSVYVDDVIVSNNDSAELSAILDRCKTVASLSRLPLNMEKLQGPAKEITAFNIRLSHQRLSITDERFQTLSSLYKNSDNPHQKYGVAGYVGSVNRRQALELNI